MDGLIIVLLALGILTGVALIGTAWSASRREWRFELSAVFTYTFDAVGRSPAVMLGVPLLVQAVTVVVTGGSAMSMLTTMRQGSSIGAVGIGSIWLVVLVAILVALTIGVFGQLLLCGCAAYTLE